MSGMITIVDENDHIIGNAETQAAHLQGLRHRIARVLYFNLKGQLYLQLRSPKSIDFPNRWDNSAAGHVDKDESYDHAAVRETMEEIGISDVKLEPVVSYYEEDHAGDKLFRRFNRVYTGVGDKLPVIDEDEVSDGRWVTIPDLRREIEKNPDNFTPGFIRSVQKYLLAESKKTP